MKILHVGATGLVGQLVLARLLESPGVARVVAPTRRPLALRHPVLENPVVDFDALPADAPWWAVAPGGVGGGAPTRRPRGRRQPGVWNPGVDFDARPAVAPGWAVEAGICTLGTTLAVAGARDAFRRVDHDYPLAVARLARGQGARTFVLTSAMGADAHSSVFYNRVKGALEEAIAALDFPALVLVRPGLRSEERSVGKEGVSTGRS